MPGFSSSSTARKTRIVRGLIHGLLDGTWGGGDHITEAEAVVRFKVSRTPVREALLELQGLGLVELRRNCGAVFSPLGSDELRDVYAVRSLLEIEATRLATPRIDPKLLKSLSASFVEIRDSRGVDPDWIYDRKLHSAIAQASGNRRLAAEIARYGNLVQTVREIVGGQALEIHATSAEEHLAIIDAMQTGDVQGASLAMRSHLSQASDSAIAARERMCQAAPA